MNCGLQSVNPTFSSTHLWLSQLQLVSILPTPHAEQSCLCLAELVKLEYSRREVPWSGNSSSLASLCLSVQWVPGQSLVHF